jgi:hypothetical protein
VSVLLTAAAAAGLAALGCSGGGDGEGPGPGFTYPLDDTLRMNHLQAKGTHNSYHIEPKDNVYDGWRFTHAPLREQLTSQGVRSFELDLHYNFATGELTVYHEAPDNETTCLRFVDCIAEIKGWSDENPAHQPLFIMLELKNEFESVDPDAYFATLEGEILSVWPEDRLVTPALVQGSAPDLKSALAGDGWPELGRIRGRALFTIYASAFVTHYTHARTSLDGRILFANSRPDDPFAGVAIVDHPITDAEVIASALEAGMLVRTLADLDNVEPFAGDTERRDAAIASGAHFVFTNFPVPAPGVNYVVELPGGTPSLCNPLTAPKECTPEAIESPAFVNAVSP